VPEGATDAEGMAGRGEVVRARRDTEPQRADLARMLGQRRGRGRGVAARVLAAAEDDAHTASKTGLVLDTVTGGDAERLYQRAGWQRVGTVPNYALMPDGALCSTTYFHKQLAG